MSKSFFDWVARAHGGAAPEAPTEAPRPSAKQSNVPSAVTQARAAAASRIRAILNSEEAIGREAMAEQLALESDLGADDAIDTLSNIARNPQVGTRGAGGYLDQFLAPPQPDKASAAKPTIYEKAAERRRNFLAGR